jgi:hypothetical protein
MPSYESVHPDLRVLLYLPILVAGGCSNPIDLEVVPLLGSWTTDRRAHDSPGSWERVLTFRTRGRFVLTTTNYGLYTGEASDQVSSRRTIRGSYVVSGDRLEFTARTMTWWDAFYDDPGPHEATPVAVLFEDCTFSVEVDELTLAYTTYPADGPVPTVMRLRRR